MTVRDKEGVVHRAVETAVFNKSNYLVAMCQVMKQLLFKDALVYYRVEQASDAEATCIDCLAIPS